MLSAAEHEDTHRALMQRNGMHLPEHQNDKDGAADNGNAADAPGCFAVLHCLVFHNLAPPVFLSRVFSFSLFQFNIDAVEQEERGKDGDGFDGDDLVQDQSEEDEEQFEEQEQDQAERDAQQDQRQEQEQEQGNLEDAAGQQGGVEEDVEAGVDGFPADALAEQQELVVDAQNEEEEGAVAPEDPAGPGDDQQLLDEHQGDAPQDNGFRDEQQFENQAENEQLDEEQEDQEEEGMEDEVNDEGQDTADDLAGEQL